jgi:hypothetical protein
MSVSGKNANLFCSHCAKWVSWIFYVLHFYQWKWLLCQSWFVAQWWYLEHGCEPFCVDVVLKNHWMAWIFGWVKQEALLIWADLKSVDSVQGLFEGFDVEKLVMRVWARIWSVFEEQRIVENEFDEVFFGFRRIWGFVDFSLLFQDLKTQNRRVTGSD